MTQAMLEIEGLEAAYGASRVLFGIGFTVDKGQIVALLGRNGAGKTTSFKAIAGILTPRHGQIRLNGRNLAGRPAYRIARAGIGYVPEDRQIFPEHTVEDNLTIAAKRGPKGEDYWTVDRVWRLFPILADLHGRIAGRLSGGEQQMLTIARTLMGNPALLLLDEPSEGLAPIIVAQIAGLVRQLAEMGVTVLLAEQNMHFCMAVASHAVIIDKGHIVYRDTIAHLKANQAISRRYLAV